MSDQQENVKQADERSLRDILAACRANWRESHRWFSKFCRGLTVTDNSSGAVGDKVAGENGLREVVTLLAALMTVLLALLVYAQKDPAPSWFVTGLYLIASLLPLIGLYSICTMRESSFYLAGHAYSYATRRISWRLLVISLLVVIGTAGSYQFRILPGQFISKGTWLDTGTEYTGVKIDRQVVPLSTATWTASLNDPALKSYKIVGVKCFRDKDRTDRVKSFTTSDEGLTDSFRAGTFTGIEAREYYFLVELDKTSQLSTHKLTKEDIAFDLQPQTK